MLIYLVVKTPDMGEYSNMNFGVYKEVLVLFIMMAAGYYSRKKGIIDKQTNRGLVELLLNITLPLLILASFQNKLQGNTLVGVTEIFLVSIAIHGILFLISPYIYWYKRGTAKRVLRFGTVFSNCAFMGYPILQIMYGKIGVFYGSIFSAPFNIALWTLGVFIFEDRLDKQSRRKALFNPGVLAVVLGFVLMFFSIELPYPIIRSFELLGGCTTPLSMIVVGSMLGEIHVKQILSGFSIYYASFVRLVLIPLGVFAVLYGLGARGIVLGVNVISVAMPIAASTAAFAERYQCEPGLASRSVFISSLLSILTIPVLIALVEKFS